MELPLAGTSKIDRSSTDCRLSRTDLVVNSRCNTAWSVVIGAMQRTAPPMTVAQMEVSSAGCVEKAGPARRVRGRSSQGRGTSST